MSYKAWYNQDADYNTNARSYMDYLARHNKFMKVLVEDYEVFKEILMEEFKQFQGDTGETIESFQNRLDNIQQEMTDLFNNWLEDGTLETIINENIFNGKADKEQIDLLYEKLNTKLDTEIFNTVIRFAPDPNGTDDTTAIQEVIDEVASLGGGEVRINEGTYWIRADIEREYHINYLRDLGGIALKDNIHLQLHENAELKVIPNQYAQYVVLRCYNKKNVKISGGTLIGDRNEHMGTAGEWGYGIAITGGENITVEDITIKNMYGDGINLQAYREDENPIKGTGIGVPTNIIINRVTSDFNLRQGMSIEAGFNVDVLNSYFINTQGKLPESGVDIEPWSNDHIAKNIRFKNCYFHNNNGGGLLITRRTTSDVEVDNCKFSGNGFENILIEGPVRNTLIQNCKLIGRRIKVRSGINTIIKHCFFDGQMVHVSDAENCFISHNIVTCHEDTDLTLSVISLASFDYGERHNINIIVENNILIGYLFMNEQGVITNKMQARAIGIDKVTSGSIRNNIIKNFLYGIDYTGDVDQLSINGNELHVIAERNINKTVNSSILNNSFFGGNFNNTNSVIYNELTDNNIIANNILYRGKGVYGTPFTGEFITDTTKPDSIFVNNLELTGL